jgi:carbon-monoxide dehydrogenase medium subunit
VKPPPFEYQAVTSVEEAVASLAQHGDEAKVLAGGQSLVPLLALRLARPEYVIDINGVRELDAIDTADGVRVGALVRQRVAERDAGVARSNPLLGDALRMIGHPATRNRGTVGGSIAHADPAAELPTVLAALDGEVEVVSQRGTRTVAAAELFAGFLTTTLEPDELVRSVRFPSLAPGTGWSFQEFSRRSGDFAIAGVAAVLRVDGNGTVAGLRIAVSGMGSTPIRARDAEAALMGQAPDDAAFDAASMSAAAAVDPPSDVHGSAAYRRHLVATLTRRALREARTRTGVAG